MILYVIAVRDSATEAFARPFFVTRPAEAIRSFSDEVNRTPDPGQQNQLHAHPSDYELFQLATFDDNLGQFTQAYERLARAVDFHFGRAAANTESGVFPDSKR